MRNRRLMQKNPGKNIPTERSAGNTGLNCFPNMDFYRDPLFQASLARRKCKVHVCISCDNTRPKFLPSLTWDQKCCGILAMRSKHTAHSQSRGCNPPEAFIPHREILLTMKTNITLCVFMIKITRITRWRFNSRSRELARDSGQRKLTFSKLNLCASLRLERCFAPRRDRKGALHLAAARTLRRSLKKNRR